MKQNVASTRVGDPFRKSFSDQIQSVRSISNIRKILVWLILEWLNLLKVFFGFKCSFCGQITETRTIILVVWLLLEQLSHSGSHFLCHFLYL